MASSNDRGRGGGCTVETSSTNPESDDESRLKLGRFAGSSAASINAFSFSASSSSKASSRHRFFAVADVSSTMDSISLLREERKGHADQYLSFA